MTIAIVHAFVSAKSNGSDSTLVQPGDWNAAHTITLAAGKIMGRTTAGAGAVQELPLAFTAAWDVTFPLTTGAITGASGTTAQRPAAPTAGMSRWNSTTNVSEVYSGTAWLSPLTNAAPFMTAFAPTGRLTLETGVPVSTTDQAGKATVYYTPAGVGYAQYVTFDGANWSVLAFTELSNDTTASATNKAGAAAAGPYQIQDLFVWNDAGTNRLTRGPKWSASATATMTLATPCVVTWTAHGLWDGATIRFTTTGALYTGLAANTDYFVTKVDANTFKLSTTLADQVAGTFIATSGTQSGVHTAFNYTSVRGAGAATTELQLLNGIYVNKYDITNGPLATKGTYVGSAYFNASSQMDLKFGGYGTAGAPVIIGIWNAFNRTSISGNVADPAASWVYNTATWRPVNGAINERVTVVSGAAREALSGTNSHSYYNASGGGQIIIGVAYNNSVGPSGSTTIGSTDSGTGFGVSVGGAAAIPFGLGYMTSVEYCSFNTGSNAVYGGGGTPNIGGGLGYQWLY